VIFAPSLGCGLWVMVVCMSVIINPAQITDQAQVNNMDIKCPFNRVAAESMRISSEALTLFHMKHDDSFRSEKTS